jgi:hypothetical protein
MPLRRGLVTKYVSRQGRKPIYRDADDNEIGFAGAND